MSAVFPAGKAGGFVMLENALLETARAVSDGAFRVLVAIRAHINRVTGEAFPTEARLAELCGRTTRTIRTALRELESAGLLVVRRTRRESGHYGTNRYKIPVEPPHTETATTKEATGTAPVTPPEEDDVKIKINASNLLASATAKVAANHAEQTAKKAVNAAAAAETKRAEPAPNDGSLFDVDKPKPNSTELRRMFESAAKKHWPDLPRVPSWTVKDKAIAKKIVATYDASEVEEMVERLWRNRLRMRCSGVPTPGFMWACISRLYGEVHSPKDKLGEYGSATSDGDSLEDLVPDAPVKAADTWDDVLGSM